jgi:hypothetical protein
VPYEALITRIAGAIDYSSPIRSPLSPLSDFVVQTPPVVPDSMPDLHTSLSTTVSKSVAVQRAKLFIQGRHLELIRSLNIDEKRYEMFASINHETNTKFDRAMATWLYEFWQFAFKTAKYWGREPRAWSADNLRLLNNVSRLPSDSADSRIIDLDMPDATLDEPIYGTNSHEAGWSAPSKICKWSLHVEHDGSDPDSNDESWPISWYETSFEDRMINNLESGRFFSGNGREEPPLSSSHIALAASRSRDELLRESIGFAILGRNCKLLKTLLKKANENGLELSGLWPYHLATTYLDGSRGCCLVFETLNNELPRIDPFSWELYRNDLGHTVLDTIFITILRNHTSMSPGMIDQAFREENRVPGEEVDICGRWDADSECYRELLARGETRVPLDWKHNFCHSSVQTVCHLFRRPPFGLMMVFEKSGLFERLCGSCGERLKLPPLHALVVVCYYLLTFGLEGEDLFGAVTCLLAFLRDFIKLDMTADVSIPLLLDLDPGTGCSHKRVTAATLADLLPIQMESGLSSDAVLGWRVFCQIIRLAESVLEEEAEEDGNINNTTVSDFVESNISNLETYAFDFNFEMEVDNGEQGSFPGYVSCEGARCGALAEFLDGLTSGFAESNILGHLWAAVQAELLHYRRLNDEEPVTSREFDMGSILTAIEEGQKPIMPLFTNDMVKPYCIHGEFGTDEQPRAEHVIKRHEDMVDMWEDNCRSHIVES